MKMEDVIVATTVFVIVPTLFVIVPTLNVFA